MTADLATDGNQDIARTELEVWRLAHRVGADFINRLATDAGLPPTMISGARTYRDYVTRVLTEAGYPTQGTAATVTGEGFSVRCGFPGCPTRAVLPPTPDGRLSLEPLTDWTSEGPGFGWRCPEHRTFPTLAQDAGITAPPSSEAGR